MQGRESILPPTATLPSYPYLFKRLVTEGLSVSLIASLLIILQFIDSFTVYKGLINSGYSAHQAMVTKGVYDRGQLLVQLAMVVSTGLASGLLPLLRMQERAGETQGLSPDLTFYSADYDGDFICCICRFDCDYAASESRII